MALKVTAIRKPGGSHNTHEHITRIRALADDTSLVFEQAVGEVIAALEREGFIIMSAEMEEPSQYPSVFAMV